MGLALVVAYIALNLLSPGDIFPSLAPYRLLLVLAIASVPPLIFARLSSPQIGKLRTQLILVILFFGWACASWLPHGAYGANLETVFELAPNVMAYFMGVVFLTTPFRLQVLRTTLVFVAIFVMANAFLQFRYASAVGDSTPYVMVYHTLDYSTEDLRIRGLGMLNDPNQFGQYLLMVLPMLFVSKSDTYPGPKYLVVIPIALLFLVGVYLTGSRGAELGILVLLGLFVTKRFRTTGAVAAAVLGLLLLLGVNAINAFSSRAISMAGGLDRLAIWSDGLSYFKQSPLWGIGIRAFRDRQGMTAHNSYLLCAAELGMVGYFLWMSMVVVTVIQLTRVPKVVGKSNPLLARWAMALRFSLLIYLFTSFFLSRTYDLPLFLLLGMAGGIVIAAGGDEAVSLQGSRWPAWSLGLCGSILVLIYVMLRLRVV